MLSRSIFLLLCIFTIVPTTLAQEAESSLKQFEGKVLILRHPLHDESQMYDPNGAVLKGGVEESWTIGSGILVDHVNLTPDMLRVEGRRIFFLFPKEKLTLFEFKRLKSGGPPPLSPSVNIEIQLNHPVESKDQGLDVLKHVFALDTSEFLKPLPDYWRLYLTAHHLHYDPSQPQEAAFRWRKQADSSDNAVAGVQTDATNEAAGDVLAFHIGEDVKPPQARSTVAPEYTKIAQYEKYRGIVVLSIVVGPDGNVHRIKLIRPLGMGMDEVAQSTVQTWRFKPSAHKGKPVAVAMNVEVAFN